MLNKIIFFIIITLSLFCSNKANTAESEISSKYEQALQNYNDGRKDDAYISLKAIIQQKEDHIPAKILLGKILLSKGYYSDAELILQEALTLGADIEYILTPLSEALFYQSKYKEVLDIKIKKRLSKPVDVAWRLQKARAFSKLNLAIEELSELQSTRKLSPNNSATLNALASYYLRHEDNAKARTFLLSSFEVSNTQFQTWLIQGKIYEQEGKIKKAEKAYLKASTLAPQNLNVKRSLASLYIKLEERQKAIILIEEIILKSPHDFQSKLLKANLLLTMDSNDLAKDILHSINQDISIVSNDTLAENEWLFLVNGITAYLLKNYESAARELNNYLTVYPNNLKAISLLANTYIALNQKSYARTLLDKHINKVTQDIDTAITLCDLYIAQNIKFKSESLLLQLETLYPNEVKVLLLKARFLASNFEYDTAILLLEKALVDKPNMEINSYLITLYITNEQSDKATYLIKSLLKQHPNNLALLNALSAALINLEYYQKAYDITTHILSINPNYLPAMYNRAVALYTARMPKSAKSTIVKLIKHAPENLRARMLLAKIEVALGQSQDAITALSDLLTYNHLHVEANEMLTKILILNGRYEEALIALNSLTKIDRLEPEYIKLKAQIFMSLNEHEQMIKQFNILSSLYFGNVNGLISLSKMQQRAKDIKGARQSMNRALALSPNTSDVLFADAKLSIYEINKQAAKIKMDALKGSNVEKSKVLIIEADLFLSQKQALKAQDYYLKAFEFNNYNGMAIAKAYNLAVAGYDGANFEKSLTEVLNKQPSNFYYRNLLADYFLHMQRFSEAKYHYKKIINVNKLPNKADVLNNLAYASMQNDLDGALTLSDQAVKLKPNSAVILDTNGWILSQLKKYQEALPVLRKAQSIDATDPNIYYHLGYTLHYINRTKEAITELKKARSSLIDFPEKDDALALLKTLI